MLIIDTIQELVNGQKQDVAPITLFDAVKVSEDSDKTLTDVVRDLSGNRNTFEATKGGYAVILEWFDRNETNENRVGKFVTIDKKEFFIKLCCDFKLLEEKCKYYKKKI